MIDVFISYASEDRERAEQIFEKLKAMGYRPWLDERMLLPGQRWEDILETALLSSDVCIFLLSSVSLSKRGMVQKEMNLAFSRLDQMLRDDIYILPVRLENVEVPRRLAQFQWVDYFDPHHPDLLAQSLAEAARQRGKLNASSESESPIVVRFEEATVLRT